MKQAVLLALNLCLVVALRAPAQDPPREPAVGTVKDVGITTIYLKDEKGNLVPVPGFTYEHYRDLLLKAGAGIAEPPPFDIEKLSLQGSLQGDVCQLEAEAVIRVRKPGWVMVPLRMPRSALREGMTESAEPPGKKGEVQVIHRYDAKEGHVVWLGGAQERRHTLRLPLAVRVARVNPEEQLSLLLPKASESRLSLDVPGKIGEAVLKTGDGLLETKAALDGRSQIEVMGAAGDLLLAWNPDRSETGSMLDLAVVSEIDVNVETRDTIGFTAKVRASRPGGVVRKLLVRLPPQTEFIPRLGKDFKVTAATEEDLAEVGLDRTSVVKSAVVRVDFERPAESGDLVLEANYKPEGRGNQSLELAGFEILGAGRQSGFVSIHLPSGWSLKATPSASAFRTDDVPSLPGTPVRPSTRYRFLRQPFSLRVDLAPQPPRTVVEPTYFAIIQPQRITLTANLDYQVRGPAPAFVEIDPGDWQIDSVGTNGLVELEPGEKGQPARLNLLPGTSGDFHLELQLHRELPADGIELAFGLPRPLATQTLPATVAIVTADNIALNPQADGIRSLVPDSRPQQLPATLSGRPMVYRELPAAAEPPRFAASFQVRKRRVTTTIEGRAQLGAQRANIEQRLALQVAYEPLATIVLEAPANTPLIDLTLTQSGQLLDVYEDPVSAVGAAVRRWRVELLNPVTGGVELAARYAVLLPQRGELPLPLVVPVEEQGLVVAEQRLVVEPRARVRLALTPKYLDDPGLSVVENSQGLVLTWPRKSSLVALERPVTGGISTSNLRIERQWLQTWLTSGSRSDRFVARIAGAQQQVGVLLPGGVAAEDVRVLLDGQPPLGLNINDTLLTVHLPEPSSSVRTLEVWYQLPAATPRPGPRRQTLALPRIAGAATPMQTWVQVLTPAGEQVLYSPSPVTTQQAWRKQGWLWQRGGALTTPELEAWLNASPSEELLPEGNEALFMSLGSLESIEIVVWGRRWLWICVAGGTFLAVLLIWRLSRGRSYLLIGGLALAGILAALVSPEIALSVSQYVGVGLLLFAAVVWSLRVTGTTPRQPAASSAVPSTIQRRADLRPSRRESSHGSRESVDLVPTATEER